MEGNEETAFLPHPHSMTFFSLIFLDPRVEHTVLFVVVLLMTDREYELLTTV